MNSQLIPIVTVSYNSPDLIEALLGSLRKFYTNPVYVIDGSYPEVAAEIGAIAAKYANVQFIPFGYNIHHGPGLSWAINNLGLSGQVLFLDSDVEILKAGFIESLQSFLTPELYGVGGIQQVNEQGYDHPDGAVAYLHPACMLCNIDVVRQWPLPIKHGAPLVQTMVALHKAGQSGLLRNVDWVKNDFSKDPNRIFIKHDWQGTVLRTGGYHYDKPTQASVVNTDLLAFVPLTAHKLVEVGCHDGAFAKAYKQRNPVSNYTGIEIDSVLANHARPHCDFVFNQDVEQADAQCRKHVAHADCWILGEVLEQLQDPWALLAAIRTSIAPAGVLVASVGNFQHWSVQARLALGDLRYEDGGSLQKKQVRVFTRGTILDMLRRAGFQVTGGMPRIKDEPAREQFLPAIRALAAASGNDAEAAVQDALPYQYIITAVAA
ncbi:MAG TPA: methyltransferase domain-containing protein [Telluria sp.]|nr:methyltransferase domain-containing protein [Telluria sp.]